MQYASEWSRLDVMDSSCESQLMKNKQWMRSSCSLDCSPICGVVVVYCFQENDMVYELTYFVITRNNTIKYNMNNMLDKWLFNQEEDVFLTAVSSLIPNHVALSDISGSLLGWSAQSIFKFTCPKKKFTLTRFLIPWRRTQPHQERMGIEVVRPRGKTWNSKRVASELLCRYAAQEAEVSMAWHW